MPGNKDWRNELNERLHDDWKKIATYLQINDVDQEKIKANAGSEILGILKWLRAREKEDEIWDAAKEIDRVDVLSLKPDSTSKSIDNRNVISLKPDTPSKLQENNGLIPKSIGSSKHFYATFGAPATGKSALVNKVRKNYSNLYCTTSDIVDNHRLLRKYLKKLFVDDSHEYFYNFQTVSFALRASYAIQYSQNSFHDETIFDSLAYAQALNDLHNQNNERWLNDEDYDSFEEIFNALNEAIPKPDVLIHLHSTDASFVYDRLRKKEYVNGFKFTFEYVKALLKAFEELSIAIPNKWGIKVIDYDIKEKSEEEIYDDVVKKLNLDMFRKNN